MSVTHLPYANEAYINPIHVFGHKRDGPYKLKSTIPVTDMLIKNKDAFSAGVVIGTVTQESWLDNGRDDVYIRNAAHSFACIDKIVKDNNGDIEHCGDCTKVSCSCDICIFENKYLEGLLDLSYFEDLLQIQNEEIKNKLKQFTNQCVLFMTICQFQAKHWIECMEYYKKKYNEGGLMVPFNQVCPSYIDCLNEFLAMQEDEQMILYNRMLKVREYIENPIPIEGIPWW